MMRTPIPLRPEPGGRSLIMPIPNPRRRLSPVSDQKALQDGRKRRKFSHSPGEESSSPIHAGQTIGDEMVQSTRVLTSHESGSSDQSASKWYNAASHDATSAPNQAHGMDDDPPFYMSHRATYLPNSFAAIRSDPAYGNANFSRNDSENEDLRGVIDDLTVENKRLKTMIRSQQKPSRDNLIDLAQQQDKLFEVRMHGLPPDKRRELELLLKNFATSMHTSIPTLQASTSNGSASATSGSQNQVHRTTPITDSGYGSNSTTGSMTVGQKAPKQRPSTTKNVQSYLKDIPDILLPKHSPHMSERAKQALVVRRLEQLFVGRLAAPGAHDQPMQQQEISHSAARADKLLDTQNNLKRNAEGNREARVMHPNTRVNLDTQSVMELSELPRKKSLLEDIISRPASPEQRPTRPLDLDIYRAQIADDNIEYLRHLGLSSPRVGKSTENGERPWVSLVLLSGLAQLHTLNVTLDTVRKAIKRLSKQFELSTDGYKVRWIGGTGPTIFAAEDEKAIEFVANTSHDSVQDVAVGGSRTKRSKSDRTSDAAITSNTPSEDKASGPQRSGASNNQQLTASGASYKPSSTANLKRTAASSAFDYKPIVYGRRTTLILEDDLQDSSESNESPSADSPVPPQSSNRSHFTQKNKDDGLITFYNNPHFCSDFNVEHEPQNMKAPRPVVVGETLGVPVSIDLSESPLRHHDGTYFTPQFAGQPFDIEQLSATQKHDLERSIPNLCLLSPLQSAGDKEIVPMNFEVCGLGGITPADNFALDVETQLKPVPRSGPDAMVRTLPFSRRRYFQKYITRPVSCQKINLLPSKLPAPSYVFFTSSSSSENVDADEEDLSDEGEDTMEMSDTSPSAERYPAPPSFLRQFSSESRQNKQSDKDDGRDSSEIDMLAIARQSNPKEIAEQERMYMLYEPAIPRGAADGSLAATVGASMASSSVQGARPPTSVAADVNSSESASDGELDADMSDA